MHNGMSLCKDRRRLGTGGLVVSPFFDRPAMRRPSVGASDNESR